MLAGLVDNGDAAQKGGVTNEAIQKRYNVSYIDG